MAVIRALSRRLDAVIRFARRLFGKRPAGFRRGVTNTRHLESRFNTVFHMLPQSRREDLIGFYQRRKNCSREQAMERAIEDQARDNGLRL